jgi:hypothetical protein
MSRSLWSLGTMLVMLGIAASMFGWDALLWVPRAALDAVQNNPGTYGVIAAGILLMVVARMIGGRGS